jgi:hypothetical protein
MSDSAQESQKRHFSKIRPHVLESGLKEGPDDEAIEVHGRADHCGAKALLDALES